MSKTIPVVLTIAGSDSGGGAGVQADLKTFTTLGVFGASVITAVTAQNTQGIKGINYLPAEFVKLQLETVLEDIKIEVIKTGMLPTIGIIKTVAEILKKHEIKKIVVDPVIKAEDGTPLLDYLAIETFINHIVPLAFVITPNIKEAEILSGVEIKEEKQAKKAAEIIYKLGAKNVVLKGGHLKGNFSNDLLFDGKKFLKFEAKRIKNKNVHGTGCTFASAIAVKLAKGKTIPEAVKAAKNFTTQALCYSLSIGKGKDSVNHLWKRVKSTLKADVSHFDF